MPGDELLFQAAQLQLRDGMVARGPSELQAGTALGGRGAMPEPRRLRLHWMAELPVDVHQHHFAGPCAALHPLSE